MTARRRSTEDHQAELDEGAKAPAYSGGRDQVALDQQHAKMNEDAEPGHPLPEPPPEKAAHETLIADTARRFMAALPPGAAAGGSYEYPESDEDGGDVPDGKYRIAGSDWVFEWEGGKPKSATKAHAPDWGGEDVQTVSL